MNMGALMFKAPMELIADMEPKGNGDVELLRRFRSPYGECYKCIFDMYYTRDLMEIALENGSYNI